jgi:hypothetical protein
VEHHQLLADLEAAVILKIPPESQDQQEHRGKVTLAVVVLALVQMAAAEVVAALLPLVETVQLHLL